LPESPEEFDSAVRLAAFAFLEGCLLEGADETISSVVLRKGFIFRGSRVPLWAPQGIFKPAVLPEMPLSIRTTPPRPDRPIPYDDAVTADGTLLYAFRTGNHADNSRLEKAMMRKAPLIYLRGIVPGRYLPFFPVYVTAMDPSRRIFSVPLDDAVQSLRPEPVSARQTAQPQRSYITVPVKRRLHQASFRERVLRAYRECCAICRLRHRELLDATHILPDADPRGEPVVSNGLSLCKLHHAAYDAHILGIRPDLRIDVRTDVLREMDGPMLLHGLQGFQGQRLLAPRHPEDRPNRDYLAEQYERFQRAS
jgi:putative restriction endonuclease